MNASDWKKKPLEMLKSIKTFLSMFIGDKFTMSIRYGK